MKSSIFIILLLLPTIAAAQTQSRERRSAGAETQTETAATRDRLVGPKAANHASPKPAESDVNRETQDSASPNWGNTSVILRPSQPVKTTTPPQVAAARTETADTKEPKKLVQPTISLTDTRVPAARVAPAAKPLGGTAVYKVGIGDVLDVRLANMPTRESTLFTVMKNGTLEYPLLSGPVSVVGMTTDEVASLLSNEIKVIRAARVNVSVRDYASHAVVVNGLVDSPGRKLLRREAMPLYAVLAEAMVRPEATTATIVRNGKEGEGLPLNNEQAVATLVQAGDVIKISGVPVNPSQFLYVGGAVASPGEKVFRDGMTLTQALLAAGGASRTENTVVRIARRNANGFLSTNEYKLRGIAEGKSPDPILQPGDRIEVTRGM